MYPTGGVWVYLDAMIHFFGVLVMVTIAVMKHHDQCNFEKNSLFDLWFHTIVHHQRAPGQELKQGRNQKSRTVTEAIE